MIGEGITTGDKTTGGSGGKGGTSEGVTGMVNSVGVIGKGTIVIAGRCVGDDVAVILVKTG